MVWGTFLYSLAFFSEMIIHCDFRKGHSKLWSGDLCIKKYIYMHTWCFFQKYIIYVYDILCVMFSHVNLEACNENSLAPRLEANLLWSLLLQGLDTSYVKCLWRRRRGRWWDLNWFTGLLDIETLLFANCYIKTLSLQFSDVFSIRMYCGESVNPRVSYMIFRPSSCPKGSIVYSRFRRRGKLETCRDSRPVGIPGDGDSSLFEMFEAKNWNARFFVFLTGVVHQHH